MVPGQFPGSRERALRRLGCDGHERRAAEVPVHRGAGERDRASVAGPLGVRARLLDAEPDRPARRGPEGSGRSARALRARHVPVSQRQGAARRPSARLHRHRRLRALPAHERSERAARDGLRRVRLTGRAVRGADGPAPARHDRAEHRDDEAAVARAGVGARPASRAGHDRRVVLPLDAVDLPADLQLVVRRRRGSRASDRGAGRGVPQRRARDPLRRHLRRVERRANSGSWSTPTGWRTSTKHRSTGARAWAPCWPTKR